MFAGGGYGFRSSSIRDVEPGGLLDGANIPGSQGGTTSSVWAGASWDTRDKVYFPTKGRLYQLTLGAALPLVGSDFTYTEATIDVRQYLSPIASHVIALQLTGRFLGGRPPFRSLVGVGDVLRGYSSARYIDRNVIALQAEYRVVPLWWRIGFVGFAGVGEVASAPWRSRVDHLKYAVGAGLRFQLYRREAINVRWDYGLGRDSSGDYLDISEAF